MVRYKKEARKYKLLFFSTLSSTIILLFFVLWNYGVSESLEELFIPELSTEGFTEVEKIYFGFLGDVSTVTMKAGCYELTAIVEKTQAESLERGMRNEMVERPNAHDLSASAFELFGIDVLMVKITGVRNNTYLSKIFLRKGNVVLGLDARPSDAMAIALRMNSSIYVNNTLLEEYGKYVC